jgi:hypothetical protein
MMLDKTLAYTVTLTFTPPLAAPFATTGSPVTLGDGTPGTITSSSESVTVVSVAAGRTHDGDTDFISYSWSGGVLTTTAVLV